MENFLKTYKNEQYGYVNVDKQTEGATTTQIPAKLMKLFKNFDPSVLQFLTSLNISHCQIDKVPCVIKLCSCLQELNLSGNSITELPPEFIVYYFPYLKILDVMDNRLHSLEQLQDLGCMEELEILNCTGNPIPKISARIQLLEDLLFTKQQRCEQTYKLGKKMNKYSVFLTLGSYNTVMNHFSDALGMAVRADDWLTSGGNEIEKIQPHLYENNDLTVDSLQLLNGSLFRTIEVDDDVFVAGPSFILQKDARIEAPFVIYGKMNKQIVQQAKVSKDTKEQMQTQMKQVDKLLGKLKNYDLVSEKAMKFGFFGQLYFIYSEPYKTEVYVVNKKQKLTTTQFIAKKTVKDFKINTDIPAHVFEILNIDPYEMLPTEIEKLVKNHLNEEHYFINMNQRHLNRTSQFPRLRILNGEQITINDVDKATNQHEMKKTAKELAESAAYMHCRTKIPTILKQAVAENEQIRKNGGMAAEDMKKQSTQVTMTRPLSEIIKRRQIYERLVKLSKEERSKAYDEMKQFILDGQLQSNDDSLEFAKILKDYDDDKLEDSGEFMRKCKEIYDTFAQENGQKTTTTSNSVNLASTILQSGSIKQSGPFSKPTNDNTVKTIASPLFQSQNLLVSGSQGSNYNDVKPLEVDDLEQEEPDQEDQIKLLRDLAHKTPSIGVSHKLNFEQQEEKQQKELLKQQMELQFQTQSRIQQSLLINEMQQEELESAENKQPLMNASQIRPIGMQSSMNIKDSEALVSNNKIKLSADPLTVIKGNLSLYKKVPTLQFQYADKSQIMKQKFEVDSKSLQLDSKMITLESLRNMSPQKEFVGVENLPHLQNSPQLLQPDIQMILKDEIKEQHKDNNELFAHVSRNIDIHVRKSLKSVDSQFNHVEEKQMRHSSLLDVVLEGDRITGNPNALKLESEYIGRLKPEKLNEAQEIMNSKKTAIPEAKSIAKTQNRVLQHTSKEIVQYIDNEIKRGDLAFEQERYSHKIDQNNITDQENLMKQLIKTNNQEIEKQFQKKIQQEHEKNLQLIANEKGLALHIKNTPTLITYTNEQRKLDRMREKAKKKEASSQVNTYVNEQQRYAVITDQSTIAPIPIQNKTLKRQYKTDVVQPLNVPSVEEAATHAGQMHIEADELIKMSTFIMRNSDKEIKQLEQYQQQFIDNEKKWDEDRADPVKQLLMGGVKNDGVDDVADDIQTKREPTYNATAPIVKQMESELFQIDKDLKNNKNAQIKSRSNLCNEYQNTINDAVKFGESYVQQLENAIEDV